MVAADLGIASGSSWRDCSRWPRIRTKDHSLEAARLLCLPLVLLLLLATETCFHFGYGNALRTDCKTSGDATAMNTIAQRLASGFHTSIPLYKPRNEPGSRTWTLIIPGEPIHARRGNYKYGGRLTVDRFPNWKSMATSQLRRTKIDVISVSLASSGLTFDLNREADRASFCEGPHRS